ncbi:MAG: MBL fold metallo-hydrolase [Chloroflexi bacterium]|nr:MAG: MBL fold metallo-hydrolase [Chloroflexota bacterium]
MTIAIQFLGAVETVTGSQYLVTAGDRRILVDCGFFQGSPSEVARNRMPLAYDAHSVDALLLTHAHLDHCGRIPSLVKAGFSGPIHATGGTLDLTEIVLRDSAKLQEEGEARWLRHHPEAAGAADTAEEETAVERDDPGMPARLRAADPEAITMSRAALYHPSDVDSTVQLFHPVAYEESLQVAPGISAKFHDAGHILGSAIIELTVEDAGGPLTVVFSGDLGRRDTPILRDPTPISHADFVLVESTYGNREHGPMEQAVNDLAAAVSEVANGNGVLLVPSFAIGRTQELVWELDELLRNGRIPKLPLFLDSPMASRASDVYMRHPEDYDEETAGLIRSGGSPLEYPGEEFTNDADQSKAIRTNPKPFMIVASSGMLTGGRILHHLKDFLPDPASMLLFIGYQGQGSLGYAIQHGAKEARIDGQKFPVNCKVRSISGFSAHADEHELEDWVRNFAGAGGTAASDGRPKTIFVVHGDPDAASAFAERIRGDLGLNVQLPTYRQDVVLRQ